MPAAASLLVVLERLQAREERVPIDRDVVDADALTPDPTPREALASREVEPPD